MFRTVFSQFVFVFIMLSIYCQNIYIPYYLLFSVKVFVINIFVKVSCKLLSLRDILMFFVFLKSQNMLIFMINLYPSGSSLVL